jgi:hypothetical protein
MSTTIDDLIFVKDEAVAFAYRVRDESDDDSLRISAAAIIEQAELYDAAEGDERVTSMEMRENLLRAIEELRAAEWPSVADDLDEGVSPDTVLGRLYELQDNGEDVAVAIAIVGAIY